MHKVLNNVIEARIASVCLAATLIAFAGLFHYLVGIVYDAYIGGQTRFLFETILFATCMFFIAYGNILYQVCLLGYYKRRQKHKPTPNEVLEQRYVTKAPSLAVLIPSYKEERKVNWQTMISAALAEYPSKEVILLIDDPYYSTSLPDRVKLEDTRKIPQELQALFDEPAAFYRAREEAFRQRRMDGSLFWKDELERLAGHYDNVAEWLHKMAADFMGNQSLETLHYSDRFFVETILYAPAKKHNERAALLRRMVDNGKEVSNSYIACQYARLAGLFTVNFSSFERKKYTNLSHEANKAMNLNSYIGLIGKSWKEVQQQDGTWHLYECAADHADFTIPDADYVNTIDSDSLMTCEYALRLTEIMEKPGNEKLAAIQSPCSSFQGCPKSLERTAGSCIDIQFETHQGYTYWGASFWVGANAMLRKKALEEIREERMENGHPISIYIQDRTVIEDTESTIDLVHKGWQLYNYPERMTFSATPPDYGSLLIQRRRWSNGGLIILPKLFRYVFNSRKNLMLAKELFMRFHYLASTATGCFAAMALLTYPFGDVYSTVWLPLSIIPFLILHIRDLRNNGYQASDALRICAMNLMLLPIVTGGVLKMFQQMVTGAKIPFGRTPKVPGRTAAPALYSFIAVLMPLAFIVFAGNHIMAGRWTQTVFSLINASLLTYALVNFIGVKAAIEDMMAGIKSRWSRAEIIPIPSVHQPAAISAMPVAVSQ